MEWNSPDTVHFFAEKKYDVMETTFSANLWGPTQSTLFSLPCCAVVSQFVIRVYSSLQVSVSQSVTLDDRKRLAFTPHISTIIRSPRLTLFKKKGYTLLYNTRVKKIDDDDDDDTDKDERKSSKQTFQSFIITNNNMCSDSSNNFALTLSPIMSS